MSTLYCFFYLSPLHSVFFFFNDTATTEIYTLSYTTLFRSLRLPEQPVGDLGAPEEADALAHDRPEGARLRPRSEEHTSELQSLAYLVCRLLLEKKKKNNHILYYRLYEQRIRGHHSLTAPHS